MLYLYWMFWSSCNNVFYNSENCQVNMVLGFFCLSDPGRHQPPVVSPKANWSYGGGKTKSDSRQPVEGQTSGLRHLARVWGNRGPPWSQTRQGSLPVSIWWPGLAHGAQSGTAKLHGATTLVGSSPARVVIGLGLHWEPEGILGRGAWACGSLALQSRSKDLECDFFLGEGAGVGVGSGAVPTR